jgi:hypothetical protein
MADKVNGTLPSDKNSNSIQVFTTKKMLAVTTDTDVTFEDGDMAFRVPVEISYSIDGGTEVLLQAGSVTGIDINLTYAFSADSTIEVM